MRVTQDVGRRAGDGCDDGGCCSRVLVRRTASPSPSYSGERTDMLFAIGSAGSWGLPWWVGLLLATLPLVMALAAERLAPMLPKAPPAPRLVLLEDLAEKDRPRWARDDKTVRAVPSCDSATALSWCGWQDQALWMNYVFAALWPYLRAMGESAIEDMLAQPIEIGGGILRVELQRASLGSRLPLAADGCTYKLQASREELEIIAHLTLDTDMEPSPTFVRAMAGAPGSAARAKVRVVGWCVCVCEPFVRAVTLGDSWQDFAVELTASLVAAGTQLSVPIAVTRVRFSASVRFVLVLNAELPFMSVVRISILDKPDLDLRIEIGPVALNCLEWLARVCVCVWIICWGGCYQQRSDSCVMCPAVPRNRLYAG